jgi:hypothetical protein
MRGQDHLRLGPLMELGQKRQKIKLKTRRKRAFRLVQQIQSRSGAAFGEDTQESLAVAVT